MCINEKVLIIDLLFCIIYYLQFVQIISRLDMDVLGLNERIRFVDWRLVKVYNYID